MLFCGDGSNGSSKYEACGQETLEVATCMGDALRHLLVRGTWALAVAMGTEIQEHRIQMA